MILKYKSVFDIIGPIMVGPSSSHTAGAARIGLFARKIFAKQPTDVTITLYGSFAKTYKGHGTDVALIGGLLNFDTDDERIPAAKQFAKKLGMNITFIESEEEDVEHPNTVRITLSAGENTLSVVGISIGGGKMEIIEINGFPITLSGAHQALFIIHEDRYGAIAKVSSLLADHRLNIGKMEVARKEKNSLAIMIIELDQQIESTILEEIEKLPHVRQVALIGE